MAESAWVPSRVEAREIKLCQQMLRMVGKEMNSADRAVLRRIHLDELRAEELHRVKEAEKQE